MGLRLTRIALLAAALFLLAATSAAAVPPRYLAGWPLQPDGLRRVGLAVDQSALCKGPSGTVYEVTVGQTTATYAMVEQVRMSNGTTARWWTYPANPGAAAVPRAAATDAEGDLYLAVETLTGSSDWVVLKYSSRGRRLWKRTYDSGDGADVPYAMVVDRKGSVIVAGAVEHAGGQDGAVVKWSASGRLKWKRRVSGPSADVLDAVAVDAHDNVYAVGQRSAGDEDAVALVRSWTPGGRQRWSATVAAPGTAPSWRRVVVERSWVYVAGQSTGTASTNRLMAMRYTTAGRRAWTRPRTLAFSGGAWAADLAVDGTGAAVVVGTAFDAGAAFQDAGAVWKLRRGGRTAWSHTFTASAWPYDGEFDAVGVDRAGRVYAAGGQYITADAGNLLLVRYSSSGAEQALWRTAGQEDGFCAFADVLVLSDTRVVAAGRITEGSAGVGVYRAKTTP